jgi:uncharacterized membrane protein
MNSFFWSKLYLLTVPVFFLIDMVWLGLVARDFYKQQLQSLLSPQVNWTAAFLFYFIYIAGILFFAVRPGLETGSFGKACLYGALFGFFTYMTYDLTNLATLRDWPLLVTVVDIAWGTVLCTLVSSGAYLIGMGLQRG